MEHKLEMLAIGENGGSWKCSCGKTGKTSRAYRGENLPAKAKARFAQHRRKATQS